MGYINQSEQLSVKKGTLQAVVIQLFERQQQHTQNNTKKCILQNYQPI